ncbi:armadillo-type protein [Crucibulum laeve]|uniref:Armadillo-type protein n=1 Tax=Crucibulum laeve TaxID=68775 RepID=A0A5C3LKZ6_9AGAR|nr:armadillo-type protein [Crucibulum laeve]
MFKNILPSKRVPSTEFSMITSLADTTNFKENHPSTGTVQPLVTSKSKPVTMSKGFAPVDGKKKKGDNKKAKEKPIESVGMEQAFDRLLDDLQIPSTLRPKLIGMDSTVKAAMLKSSQTMVVSPDPTPSPPITPRAKALRRAHSTESLNSPRHAALTSEFDLLEPPNTACFSGQVSAHHSPYMAGSPRKPSGHTRGLSFDAPRLFSRSQVNLDITNSTLDLSGGKIGKEKGISSKNISPTKFFSILSSTSTTQLDVEEVKKLRLLLRNESASWSQEFLKLGGYSALLTRLNEILEIEWREEQHDDQILHELLRCFKALSTSSIGCFALRSSCPTPFVQLVALLYSDKKPGDVATRQLIVDLLLILFELYPPSSLPSAGGNHISGRSRPHREAWDSDVSLPSSNLVTLPSPHKNFFSLIRALLLTPAPPPSESPAAPISPHAFIESLHRPRIYKTYLQELSDVCRDYFWVFCHPNNTIWVLSETDEGRVEKPRAPGGMTGGVEFEAMGYFTTHLRLLNAIAQSVADLDLPKDHDHSAYRFHSDLFLSGLERIILISRKASTTYYPTLHLELARYIAHAGRTGYELPYTVSRLIGMPPPALAKNGGVSSTSSGRNTPRNPGTPTKRTGASQAPALPSPRKIEPIKFD